MVAKEYNLNPLLREIHAFPKKGGGIQPVISIDGWVSLINQNPQLDGYTFEWTNDAKGDPISCKCIMFRKDRKHPVVVEEFLSECIRPTEPWKMKHRMLRHKAMIQAARYAFGFSGIMDADEADAIAAMKDITPAMRPQMSDFAPAEPAAPAAAPGTVAIRRGLEGGLESAGANCREGFAADMSRRPVQYYPVGRGRHADGTGAGWL